MTAVDWTSLAMGFAAGALMSVLYFAGLAIGLKRALRAGSATVVLAVSAAFRIAALLGVGWMIVAHGGPWAFGGYAAAFLVFRRVAITMARVKQPVECAQ